MKKTIIYLMLVFTAALFTTAAKWAEKPIDDLASIAGAWSGSGCCSTGYSYTIKYWFKEDGSLRFTMIKPPKGTKDNKKKAGTLWVEAGKLRYKSGKGPWTFTLYENKKGKQKLRGARPDGNKQELTRAK